MISARYIYMSLVVDSLKLNSRHSHRCLQTCGLPHVVAVRSCPDPPAIPNAVYQAEPTNVMVADRYRGMSYAFRRHVRYYCIKGYELVDSVVDPVLTCSESEWYGPIPTCGESAFTFACAFTGRVGCLAVLV